MRAAGNGIGAKDIPAEWSTYSADYRAGLIREAFSLLFIRPRKVKQADGLYRIWPLDCDVRAVLCEDLDAFLSEHPMPVAGISAFVANPLVFGDENETSAGMTVG